MAALAASPACCPVPSRRELVRPSYCHRAQMSPGQHRPASPSGLRLLAAGAGVRSILLFTGASARVSSFTVSVFLPTFLSCSCNQLLSPHCRGFESFSPCFSTLAGFWLAQRSGDFTTHSVSNGTPKHCAQKFLPLCPSV